jgi:nitrogen fixation protein FixH
MAAPPQARPIISSDPEGKRMAINFIDHGGGRATRRTAPREWKGWMVLVFMLAFFGVVIGVNAFMAHLAMSTFGGVDVDSSYRAGQMFERDVAMAETQDERHWRVDGKIRQASDGTKSLDLAARDSSGTPLSGLTATAQFTRPTDRRLDRAVAIHEDEPGHFRGDVVLPPGQWDLVIELTRQGERQFRSINRVVIR